MPVAGVVYSITSGSTLSCDQVFAANQTRSLEVVQQRLGVLEVRRVETLGEPDERLRAPLVRESGYRSP